MDLTNEQTIFVENLVNSQGKNLSKNEIIEAYYMFRKLFKIILNENKKLSQQAATAVHNILLQTETKNNRQIYIRMRYIDISVEDINSFDRFSDKIRNSLLCIASANGNGYVREAALNELGKIKNSRVFPYVFFRLSDWVEPIRSIASKIIDKYLEDDPILFQKNYKLVNWLLNVQRVDLQKLYSRILNEIVKKPIPTIILNELNEGERYFYYKVKIETLGFNHDLIERISNDKYHLIRFLLLKNFRKIPNKNRLLHKLLKDNSNKIRQNAILWITDSNLENFRDIIFDLVSDKLSAIREDSRKLLLKIENIDFHELYISRIKNKEKLVGSILGLSEVGTSNDLGTIQSFLNESDTKIRSAALMGVYNLDKKQASEIAYDIICSSCTARLKRTAEFILENYGVELDRLRKIYDKADRKGKIIILKLLSKFGRWSIAGDFLKAITEKDEKISEVAIHLLKSWFHRTKNLGIRYTEEEKKYILKWYYAVDHVDYVKIPDVLLTLDEKYDKEYNKLIKKIKSIPQIIPQECGVYDDWNYFIHKACNGSHKADEILTHAEYALMAFRTGTEVYSTNGNYKRILENQIIDTPPFKDALDLYTQLLIACEIEKNPKIKKKPYLKRKQYQNLWKKGYVKPYKLLHDSVLNAFENWSFHTYRKINRLMMNETLEYNSLDIVTAMIILVSSFVNDCPHAFEKESYRI